MTFLKRKNKKRRGLRLRLSNVSLKKVSCWSETYVNRWFAEVHRSSERVCSPR